MAKYPVISECPVCHGDLVVTQLECNDCGTELKGKFTLSKFNYLDTEKLYFIEVFVKNRGNIKTIEKEMGLSYPTIKKMLDEVIEQLGYSSKEEEEEVKPEYNGPSRKEILEKIDNGELSVEEAAKLLAKVK
ncbi:MAG TPA: DUF2089 domain-containing protein [Bacillota bacterium]|nr:DUF2089 domain-containing protein [Bacillota bacterium]HPJ23306.1 DUF2089 domain-containing protein [Bacillota bacterium]